MTTPAGGVSFTTESGSVPSRNPTQRPSHYKNNRIEQDRRGSKQRYHPMRGFGRVASAARFCSGFEGQGQSFRAVRQSGERVSLAERRHRFQERWVAVMAELAAA